jgi:hypothetical protein
MAVLGLFLLLTLYRAFAWAWRRSDLLSLWPFALVVFILVANYSESLFVSSEAFWALLVAAAVIVATPHKRAILDARNQPS